MISGSGIFFDGQTSARQKVAAELAPGALIVRGADGQTLAQWPYAELDQVHSDDQVLRLGRGRGSLAHRLDLSLLRSDGEHVFMETESALD